MIPPFLVCTWSLAAPPWPSSGQLHGLTAPWPATPGHRLGKSLTSGHRSQESSYLVSIIHTHQNYFIYFLKKSVTIYVLYKAFRTKREHSLISFPKFLNFISGGGVINLSRHSFVKKIQLCQHWIWPGLYRTVNNKLRCGAGCLLFSMQLTL